MRSTYKILDNNFPYFVTSTIVEWMRVFTNEVYSETLMSNFIFYQRKYNMEITAFVIMPEHFHMICRCDKLKTALQSLKSFTAKEVLKQLHFDKNELALETFKNYKANYKTQSEFQVWQEGFHPKLIGDYQTLKQKIEYIHYNPVRRGLVENPEDWKYSSARFYNNSEQCGLKISTYN